VYESQALHKKFSFQSVHFKKNTSPPPSQNLDIAENYLALHCGLFSRYKEKSRMEILKLKHRPLIRRFRMWMLNQMTAKEAAHVNTHLI
jgi:hypothetical protein